MVVVRLAFCLSSRLSFALTARRALTALIVAVAALLALPGSSHGQAAAPLAVGKWVQASPASSPGARIGSSTAYNPGSGSLLLFGGNTAATGNVADTWTWNGTTWTQQTPATSPSAREYPSLVYDAAHGNVVLFGGAGSGAMADTWTWNGTTWTQQFPATSPPARYQGPMAYDAATGNVVLFGGNAGGGNYLSDTWTWNGTTWTQQSPATSPPGRGFTTMAYNAANGTVVIFGGYNTASTYLSDTWTWNGTTWTQQSPATSPSARYGFPLVYDAATGTVLLFGGYGTGAVNQGDTWVWNGINWTQQSPATSPSARRFDTAAYDDATGAVVMFGGYSSGYVADTWNYLPTFVFGTVKTGLSSTSTATFQVTTAGTMGTPLVLTQGAPNLDFTLGTGSTCTGSVAVGTCTVNVTFTPLYPGQRMGAVELTNLSGTLIATQLMSGTGSAPLGTLSPGTISTVAGNGTGGYVAAQEGGQATAAELNAPYNTAVDGAGNLYIVDSANNRIRKVTPATGIITTVAGNGTAGYVAAQDGGAATAAELNDPTDVVVDGAGNLYIADLSNNRIRKVTVATGIISTVAGNGTGGYVTAQDGGPATSAELYSPIAVAVDGAGNLYIADQTNNRIRKVTAATGLISTVAGNGTQGYVAAQEGGQATSATLYYPAGVSVDSAGNLYIADQFDNRIRKVSPAGIITTVAGNGSHGYVAAQDGGPATSAELYYPTGTAVDGAGNLYIADYANTRVRKVTVATGIITTVAGNGTPGYVAAQDGGAGTSAELYYPTGVSLDGSGNLYIADYGNQRIRRISVKAGISFPTATAAGAADTTDGARLLTLNNIGNLPLTISSMQNNNGSYVLTNPLTGGCATAVAVPIGGSCLLGEQFAPVPGSTGVVSGSLGIVDNTLNNAAFPQAVPLSGTTVAGALNVTVTGGSVAAGTASTTFNVVVGFSGSTSPTGAVTAKVNGSAAGVGVPTCVSKGGHQNCTYPYTGTALNVAGNYAIVVTVAADSNYSAGSGTDTLAVTGTVAAIRSSKAIASPVTSVRGII